MQNVFSQWQISKDVFKFVHFVLTKTSVLCKTFSHRDEFLILSVLYFCFTNKEALRHPYIQKQSPGGVLSERCSQKVRTIQRKATVPEPFFKNKDADLRPANSWTGKHLSENKKRSWHPDVKVLFQTNEWIAQNVNVD